MLDRNHGLVRDRHRDRDRHLVRRGHRHLVRRRHRHLVRDRDRTRHLVRDQALVLRRRGQHLLDRGVPDDLGRLPTHRQLLLRHLEVVCGVGRPLLGVVAEGVLVRGLVVQPGTRVQTVRPPQRLVLLEELLAVLLLEFGDPHPGRRPAGGQLVEPVGGAVQRGQHLPLEDHMGVQLTGETVAFGGPVVQLGRQLLTSEAVRSGEVPVERLLLARHMALAQPVDRVGGQALARRGDLLPRLLGQGRAGRLVGHPVVDQRRVGDPLQRLGQIDGAARVHLAQQLPVQLARELPGGGRQLLLGHLPRARLRGQPERLDGLRAERLQPLGGPALDCGHGRLADLEHGRLADRLERELVGQLGGVLLERLPDPVGPDDRIERRFEAGRVDRLDALLVRRGRVPPGLRLDAVRGRQGGVQRAEGRLEVGGEPPAQPVPDQPQALLGDLGVLRDPGLLEQSEVPLVQLPVPAPVVGLLDQVLGPVHQGLVAHPAVQRPGDPLGHRGELAPRQRVLLHGDVRGLGVELGDLLLGLPAEDHRLVALDPVEQLGFELRAPLGRRPALQRTTPVGHRAVVAEHRHADRRLADRGQPHQLVDPGEHLLARLGPVDQLGVHQVLGALADIASDLLRDPVGQLVRPAVERPVQRRLHRTVLRVLHRQVGREGGAGLRRLVELGVVAVLEIALGLRPVGVAGVLRGEVRVLGGRDELVLVT